MLRGFSLIPLGTKIPGHVTLVAGLIVPTGLCAFMCERHARTERNTLSLGASLARRGKRAWTWNMISY